MSDNAGRPSPEHIERMAAELHPRVFRVWLDEVYAATRSPFCGDTDTTHPDGDRDE